VHGSKPKHTAKYSKEDARRYRKPGRHRVSTPAATQKQNTYEKGETALR